MAYTSDVFHRTERALPHARFADWLLRIPLAVVMLQQGFDKVPLSTDMAAGFGVPFLLWGLAAFGEIAVGAALIVAGVLYVAYWAPPVELLLYNQFHILLLAAGLYLALTSRNTTRAQNP